MKRILTILIAQFINAAALTLVMIPNRLAPTGLGGIATTIYRLTGLNMQLCMVLLAVPLLAWAIIKYNKFQVLYAAFNYFVFTFYTGLIAKMIPVFQTDAFITALVAGGLGGLGTGLIMRLGIPNGPEAIVGNYLRETKDITPGRFFLVLNTMVILSSVFYGDLTLIIYSLFSNFISSTVTDRVIVGNNRYFDVSIITDNIFGITGYIRNDLGRNVTFIQCMDTENVQKKMMLKTVISKHQLTALKLYLSEQDDGSFVYISESAGVIGSNAESL